MNTMQLLTGPLAQAVGWALLHLVWQATIVAGILAAVLALMSRKNANARYVASCGALALVFAMFVATAIRAYDPAAAPISVSSGSASSEPVKVSLTKLPVLIAETAATGLRERAIDALTSARSALPAIVGIWLAGVVFLSARLLVSWMRARRFAQHGATPASAEWQRIGAHLSDVLGLRRTVQLLESAAIEVPSVIGTLRPIILLPAAALTGMTPEQIEMVLAHEFAHIRRHDFLVNLLQAVVETVMFYHPAVWWMSRRVRIERENCCDDLAVAICGNPIQYARALTRLEELRVSALPVVVAANGGSLLDRIRRIASVRAEGTSSSPRWAAGVAVLSILLIAVAVPSLPALAQRDDPKDVKEKAQPSTTHVDVVEARTDDASDRDGDVDVNVDPDVDVDVDVDGPDVGVDVDVPDVDYDSDYDWESAVPPVPPIPSIAVAAPAPLPVPAPMATPAIAPVAPVAMAGMMTPRPPRAPRVPHGAWDDDDDDRAGDRELGAGGKLSVEELISLRATGVTPAYVNSMREIFPNLTLRQVTGMSAVGVTPQFVREMRDAGLDVSRPKDATSLAAVGVTPDYIRQMKAAGFSASSARDVTSLRAVGVTPDYIARMREAGLEVRSAHEATGLAAQGVSPEWIRKVRDAGLKIDTARAATSLAAVGVTPEWLRSMRDAGVKIDDTRDATSLAAQGVTPEFVKRLANAGYTNLSPRALSRLAAAGVDDDFIRDMQQYRKK